MDKIRENLAADLARQSEPPIDGLVAGALRRGKWMRFRRRAGATVAAVGVTVVLTLIGATVQWGQRGLGDPAATVSPGPASPSPTPTLPSGSGIAGARQPATVSTLAEHLETLLPDLTVVRVERYDRPRAAGRLAVERAGGHGVIEIEVGFDSRDGDPFTCPAGAECGHLDDHNIIVSRTPGPCGGTLRIDSTYWDDQIILSVSGCRPDGTAIVTEAEARRVAVDFGWGEYMADSIVVRGAARFPTPGVVRP